MFISSEAFCSYGQKFTGFAERLRSAGHSVTVVFVMRHQIFLINSAYTQRVKTFSERRLFDAYFEPSLQEARYDTLHFYGPIFAAANSVRILPWTPDLIPQFWALLKVAVPMPAFQIDQADANSSPLPHEIEFLRRSVDLFCAARIGFGPVLKALRTVTATTNWSETKSFWGFSDQQFEIAKAHFEPFNRALSNRFCDGTFTSLDNIKNKKKSVFDLEAATVRERSAFLAYSQNTFSALSPFFARSLLSHG